MVSDSDDITTVITYLEMTAPPSAPPPPSPAGPLAIMRADAPTVSFYRYLYNTVGGNQLWWERRVMSDKALADAILADHIDVVVLYVGGVPAGYYELGVLDGSREVEILYFGLMPEFIGRGYGAYLLRCAVDDAWSRGPERLIVNTCDLDHPNALQVYQRAGFEPYDQEKRVIPDPRRLDCFS